MRRDTFANCMSEMNPKTLIIMQQHHSVHAHLLFN